MKTKLITILTVIILTSCATPQECYGQNLTIYSTYTEAEKVELINNKLNNFNLLQKKGYNNQIKGIIFQAAGLLIANIIVNESVVTSIDANGNHSYAQMRRYPTSTVTIGFGTMTFGVIKWTQGFLQKRKANRYLAK